MSPKDKPLVWMHGEAPGGFSTTAPATRREDCHATFPADAFDQSEVPRAADPGRQA